MTSVVAIGYAQESTAGAAAEQLHRTAPDFLPARDAVAVLSRDVDGVLQLTTNHQVPAPGQMLGLFWPPLLGTLCFGPLLGSTGTGAWRDLERVVGRAGLVRALRGPLADMLRPGTSVLLLAVEPQLRLADVLDAVPGVSGSVASAEVPANARRHLHWAVQGTHHPTHRPGHHAAHHLLRRSLHAHRPGPADRARLRPSQLPG